MGARGPRCADERVRVGCAGPWAPGEPQAVEGWVIQQWFWGADPLPEWSSALVLRGVAAGWAAQQAVKTPKRNFTFPVIITCFKKKKKKRENFLEEKVFYY